MKHKLKICLKLVKRKIRSNFPLLLSKILSYLDFWLLMVRSLGIYVFYFFHDIFCEYKEYFTHRPELKKENLKASGIVLIVLVSLLALVYGIAYTMSLTNHSREIIGIVFQVITGFVFTIEQISRKEESIIKFQDKVKKKPQGFIILLVLTILTCGYFLYLCLSDFSKVSLSVIPGFLFWLFLFYYFYLYTLLNVNVFLKNWIEKTTLTRLFDLKYTTHSNWILLGLSFSTLTFTGYLIRLNSFPNLPLRIITFVCLIFFAMIVMPIFITSLLYLFIIGFLKLLIFINHHNKIRILIWMLMILLWTWGGSLLVINACS